jgi:hypothetical protein
MGTACLDALEGNGVVKVEGVEVEWVVVEWAEVGRVKVLEGIEDVTGEEGVEDTGLPNLQKNTRISNLIAHNK